MLEFLLNLFRSPAKPLDHNNPTPEPGPPAPRVPAPAGIDWTNPECEISKHFTVKDAIWFPRWSRLANEKDGLDSDAKEALEVLFKTVMDPAWEILSGAGAKSKIVTVAFRSIEYNKLIGGALASCHTARKDPKWGLIAACDFVPDFGLGTAGKNCDRGKAVLLSKLVDLKARLESNPQGSGWLHLDNRGVGPAGRYFLP